MPKQITETDRAAAIELYTKGKSMAHIERTVGVTYKTLRKLLDDEGLGGQEKKNEAEEKKEVEKDTLKEVVSMYKQKSKLSYIAAKFSVSKNTIINWLKAEGVYETSADKKKDVLARVKETNSNRGDLADLLNTFKLSKEESQQVTLQALNSYKADILRGVEVPDLNQFLKVTEVEHKITGGNAVSESRGRLTLNLAVNKKKWKSQLVEADVEEVDLEVEEVDLEVEEPTTESE